MNIFTSISDSNEMIEIIKLANHFNLTGMIRAIEIVFQDNMLQLLESNSTFLSIKSSSSHLAFSSSSSLGMSSSKKKLDSQANRPSNEGASLNGNLNISSTGRGQQSRGNGAPVQVPQSSKKQGAPGQGGQTTHSSGGSKEASGSKAASASQRHSARQRANMIIPQGLMFLPDGKALIMDTELYNHTLQNSIVIDLVDSNRVPGEAVDGDGNDSQFSIEDNKVSRNKHTDINRKPSQANQKRQGKGASGESLPFGQFQDPNHDSQTNLQEPAGLQSIQEEVKEESFHAPTVESPCMAPTKRDFLNMINQQEFSDVTLLVEGKQIFAHQVVLASRSTFFEALFKNDFSEKEQRVVDFNDSGISYYQLIQLLKHMYSDYVKIDSKHIYDILAVSLYSFSIVLSINFSSFLIM